MGDTSGYFSMPYTAEYEAEVSISVDDFMRPSNVGLSYSKQSVLNRGRKGGRSANLPNKGHDQQSFYHLQHRYTKMFSWPIIAIMIGILFVLVMFRGFALPRMATGTKASDQNFEELDGLSSTESRLDEKFNARIPRVIIKKNHERTENIGMVFRQKVFDTLQGFLLQVCVINEFHSQRNLDL